MHQPTLPGDHISKQHIPCTSCMGDDRMASPAGHLAVGTTAQRRQVGAATDLQTDASYGLLCAVLGTCLTMPATCGSGCLQPRSGSLIRGTLALGAGTDTRATKRNGTQPTARVTWTASSKNAGLGSACASANASACLSTSYPTEQGASWRSAATGHAKSYGSAAPARPHRLKFCRAPLNIGRSRAGAA